MPSLVERLRRALGTQADEHEDEHEAIRRRLIEQRLRIARIDADLDARRERRHIYMTTHPHRRTDDA